MDLEYHFWQVLVRYDMKTSSEAELRHIRISTALVF